MRGRGVERRKVEGEGLHDLLGSTRRRRGEDAACGPAAELEMRLGDGTWRKGRRGENLQLACLLPRSGGVPREGPLVLGALLMGGSLLETGVREEGEAIAGVFCRVREETGD